LPYYSKCSKNPTNEAIHWKIKSSMKDQWNKWIVLLAFKFIFLKRIGFLLLFVLGVVGLQFILTSSSMSMHILSLTNPFVKLTFHKSIFTFQTLMGIRHLLRSLSSYARSLWHVRNRKTIELGNQIEKLV